MDERYIGDLLERYRKGEIPLETALLAMLNSCAAGVAVVNVDNGFGAGYLASTINRL